MSPHGAFMADAICSAIAFGGALSAFEKAKHGTARSACSGTSFTIFRSAGAPMPARALTTASSHSFSNCSCAFMPNHPTL